jgi:hypothetical protein
MFGTGRAKRQRLKSSEVNELVRTQQLVYNWQFICKGCGNLKRAVPGATGSEERHREEQKDSGD